MGLACGKLVEVHDIQACGQVVVASCSLHHCGIWQLPSDHRCQCTRWRWFRTDNGTYLACHRHDTSDRSETLVGHVSLVCIDHVSSYLATGFFVSVKGLVMSATTVEWSIGIMSHDFDWSDLLWFILVIQKDWTLGFVRSWLISWMWRSSISWFGVPIGWLRVAIGWLRMAVGWLRVAVGWLRMAVGWLRVAVSWFRMAIGGFWVMVGWFGVTIGWFRMAISWLGVAVVGT